MFRSPGIVSCVRLYELDSVLLEQITNVYYHPHLKGHIVVLPNVHLGNGAPFGCVAPLVDVVCPNMVGEDIGCGVQAVLTDVPAEVLHQHFLETFIGSLANIIPVGLGACHQRQRNFDSSGLLEASHESFPWIKDKAHFEKLMLSLGTLGSDDYFIEVCHNTTTNTVSFMLHSGSRAVGTAVNTHYASLAESSCRGWWTGPPGLEVLVDTIDQQMFVRDMFFARAFARTNRDLMMEDVVNTFFRLVNSRYRNGRIIDTIDVEHNYADIEFYHGMNLYVHRKGAVHAPSGSMVVIPGATGSHSFIACGLGNRDTYNSCSNGAGKDIDYVMDCQKSIVSPVMKLLPKGVLKG